MTKIEEFENKLIKRGLSEEDYNDYEKLLKRAPGNFHRLQHCYTTAIQFPPKRSEQAISLIEWGLKKYPDAGYTTYTAYYDIGIIHERCGAYQPAYEAYLKAADELRDDQLAYRQTISGNLLWMLLHIDGFQYSEQLEQYYTLFQSIDDFAKGFINNEFRLCVAEIVIFSYKGMKEKASASYERALRLSKPDVISRLQGILDKHHFKDRLKNTPECAAFLKNVKL